MFKPVGIVAAMRSELGTLLLGNRSRKVNGVDLYELPCAIVAIAGIGGEAAQRAVEALLQNGKPQLLVSAGFCGALAPELKPGELLRPGKVVDIVSGSRYTADAGEAVLVTNNAVLSRVGKEQFRNTYGASIVDMEAAVVARAASIHGLRFVALKTVSDELGFAMPPVNRFVDGKGQFRAGAFACYVAVRPRWWLPVFQLARNSKLAARNLSIAVEHLIGEYSSTADEERVPQG